MPHVEFCKAASRDGSISYDISQLLKRSAIASSLPLHNLLLLGYTVGNFYLTKHLASLTVISKFSQPILINIYYHSINHITVVCPSSTAKIRVLERIYSDLPNTRYIGCSIHPPWTVKIFIFSSLTLICCYLLPQILYSVEHKNQRFSISTLILY
jgi:hypothetical protein